MTLPASGTITGAMIRAEMDGLVGNLVFPSAGTLWLAGKAAAPIVIPTDYYGKTWGPTLAAAQRFSAVNPGSTWELPSGAPWAVGDLVVVTQLVHMNTGDPTLPADVIPAGWTRIGTTITLVDGLGRGVRMNTSYRILTAGQVGATITGMGADAVVNRICGRQMHFNRPIAGVAVVDQKRALTIASPAGQNVAWDSVRNGSHIYWGAAHGAGDMDDLDFQWTTAADAPLGPTSVTRTWHKEYANTTPVSSITMAMNDMGDFNGLFAALLRLT